MPVRLLSLSSALASMSGLGLCVVSQKARHSLGSGFTFLAGSSLSCEASSEAHSSSAASAASTSTGHESADRDGSSMWSSWERRIGSFSAGSGFVMKDTVQVTRIDDPAIEGITLYLTQMKRPCVLSPKHNLVLSTYRFTHQYTHAQSHRPNPNGRPIHRPVRRFVNSREDYAAREVSQANCAHGGGGGGVLQKSESLLQVDASPARLRQGEEGAHLHQLQRAFADGHDTDEQPIPNVHRGGCARDLT